MARARILIVDDDVFVRKTLRRALGEHDLVLAEDGGQALEILRVSGPFDVILCDLMMPHVSGMDLYELLRQESPGQELCMVFLTGGAADGHTHEFVSRVANQVIEKPFDFHRLRGVVNEILAARARS